MSAEDLKPLLVAHARKRLARVAGIVACRAQGMTAEQVRTLLEVETEAACVEAAAAVRNDLRDLDDA